MLCDLLSQPLIVTNALKCRNLSAAYHSYRVLTSSFLGNCKSSVYKIVQLNLFRIFECWYKDMKVRHKHAENQYMQVCYAPMHVHRY